MVAGSSSDICLHKIHCNLLCGGEISKRAPAPPRGNPASCPRAHGLKEEEKNVRKFRKMPEKPGLGPEMDGAGSGVCEKRVRGERVAG